MYGQIEYKSFSGQIYKENTKEKKCGDRRVNEDHEVQGKIVKC